MTSSRRLSSAFFASVCTVLVLSILETANACSCFPRDDNCADLADGKAVVRGTIQQKEVFSIDPSFPVKADGTPDDQAVTLIYDVLLERVFVNVYDDVPLEKGQTIQIKAIKAGNLCGVNLNNGTDMLLDLTLTEANGADSIFTTSLCSLTSSWDRGQAEGCFPEDPQDISSTASPTASPTTSPTTAPSTNSASHFTLSFYGIMGSIILPFAIFTRQVFM